MHRFRNILVVCDERSVSVRQSERVRWLAETNGAGVTLVDRIATPMAEQDGAAVDVVSPWCVPEERAIYHGRVRLPDEQVRGLLAGEEARSAGRPAELVPPFDKRHGTRLRVHPPKGTASEIIRRHAEEQRVETTVMGTVGRVGVTGFLIGETAETIAGQVACSVPATKPQGFQPPLEAVPETGTAAS